MKGNCEIDLNSIALSCGLDKTLNRDIVMHNICELEEFYDKADLIEIYNYLLETISIPEYLSLVVKCSDSYRDASTLTPIAKLLVKRPMENDDDESINLRVICAKAIANHKDTSYVTILLACMNNKNENYKVRLACADALGKIGDRYAVTPLINLVSDEEEKSVYLKESATHALGAIGDIRAVDPLISILDSKHGIFSKFSFLKEKIIEALGKLSGSEKVFFALKKSLMDESAMVRINAIEALMNSEDDRAADCIKICLTDPDDEVKRNALIALYNITDRSILDEVIADEKYSEYLKTEAQSLIDEYEDESDE